MYACVAPVEESYVSSDERSSQGAAPVPVVTVSVTTARTSVRVPDAPAFENGRLTEEIWPLVTVKDVAEPMAVPPELRNPMVPVQDAAVPLDEAVATFTTLTCRVSELPSPIGPDAEVTVDVELVVVVCAGAQAAVSTPAADRVNANLRKDIFTSF